MSAFGGVFIGMSGSTTPTVAQAASPGKALQTGLWGTGGSSLGQCGGSICKRSHSNKLHRFELMFHLIDDSKQSRRSTIFQTRS